LLPGLDGMPVEVVETEFHPPNPWLGYCACLASLADSDCTHALVVQDDAITCRNLTPALEQIASVTDVPVCLYLGGVPMRTRSAALRAGKRGARFVEVVHGDFMPIVAVMWPIGKAREFLDWGSDPSTMRRRNGQPFPERSDDAMGGRWMKTQRQKVLATIPSLIEHPDDAASTIARKPSGRTALFWHGPEWDALSVSWML
jgi:hypothetical protein